MIRDLDRAIIDETVEARSAAQVLGSSADHAFQRVSPVGARVETNLADQAGYDVGILSGGEMWRPARSPSP